MNTDQESVDKMLKPKKRKGIFWIIFIISMAPFLVFFLSNKHHSDQRNYLKAHGEKATATILSYRSTNSYYNNVPKLKFKVQITTSSGKKFVSQTTEYIDMVDFSKLHEGLNIPALIDPEDENKYALLWNEAGIHTLF